MADDAAKAAEILAPPRKLDAAEKAALDCVDKQRWVLWHADDYATAVIRLLSRAGLLRDRDRETELAEADLVMRRLEDEAKAKLGREYSAALAEIAQLREALSTQGSQPTSGHRAHRKRSESPAAARPVPTPGAGASGGTPEAQEG